MSPDERLKEEHVLDEVVGDMRRVITRSGGSRDSASEGMTWYVLIGPHGAVQFAYISYPSEPYLSGIISDVVKDGKRLLGADVGYHAYEPQYDGQYSMECEWLLGQRECYYDGSGLEAEYWLQAWQEFDFDNDEWVWQRLHIFYERMFGGESEWDTTTQTSTTSQNDSDSRP